MPECADAGAGIQALRPQRTVIMFPADLVVTLNYYQAIIPSRVHGKLIIQQTLFEYLLCAWRLTRARDTTVKHTGMRQLLSDILSEYRFVQYRDVFLLPWKNFFFTPCLY